MKDYGGCWYEEQLQTAKIQKMKHPFRNRFQVTVFGRKRSFLIPKNATRMSKSIQEIPWTWGIVLSEPNCTVHSWRNQE